MFWFQTTNRLENAAPLVRRRRYGIIRVQDGQFHSLSFRPWPKIISRLEIATLGRWHHARGGNQCRVFYSFPLSSPGFLSVAYIESSSKTNWKTLRRCGELLDWIAEIRQANAAVCELINTNASTRAMQRQGWEPHCEHFANRHFIKRYYGSYPRHDWLPEVVAHAENFRRGHPSLNESLDAVSASSDAHARIGLVDEKVGC